MRRRVGPRAAHVGEIVVVRGGVRTGEGATVAEDEGTASLALEAPAALRPCVSPPMEHCAAVAGEGPDAVPGDRNCPWADDAVRAATDLMSASVPAVVAARFGAVIQRHIVVWLARAILLVAIDQEVGWGQCRGLRWRWGDKLPQPAIAAVRPKLRGRRARREQATPCRA